MSSFRSTVRPAVPRAIGPYDKWLVDPVTGEPVGVQNPNAGGTDATFAPILLTATQIANPTPAMLAMTNATFMLEVAPYDRYYSNGEALVGSSPGTSFGTLATISGSTVASVPAGAQAVVYVTLTVRESAELTIAGEVRVGPWPF